MSVSVTETLDQLPEGVELSPPKRRLYEAALGLFGEKGYHGVSMRDIANALGQQPSAIYFHVASKQDLLFDLTLIGHRAHHQALREGLMNAGADPVDQLSSVLRAHLRQHLDFPALARVTNRELHALAPDQLAAVLEIRRQSEQVIIDVLERGGRIGAFVVEDPFLAAKALGALGIRLPEWFSADAPRTSEQVVERYVTYALRMVCVERSP